MRLIIAGAREYEDAAILEAALACVPTWVAACEEVIEGGAPGIDALAAAWAKRNGLRHTRVVADWKRHGRKAGPLRNRCMAELGDALLAIPGEGRGTYSMIAEAKAMDLPVVVYRVEHEGQTQPMMMDRAPKAARRGE